MTGAKQGFLTFLHDRSGNVLPIAAIGMLLSAALVGGGIDMSRAYRAQNRLQAACDSGVLAGRRAVASSGLDNNAKTQAGNFFLTNFNDTAMEATNTVFTPTTPDNGQTVNGTASTTLKLAVMKIFGFQSFNLSVNCTASMGVGNSDVVMVLDTTGSMDTDTGSGTRMDALQQAMKNFYSTVKTATASTNARIRYGFVPFSSSVNVGKLIYAADPSYLVDTYHIQSRFPETKYQTTSETKPQIDNLVITDGPNRQTGDSWNKQTNCTNNLPQDVWNNVGNPEVTTTSETNGSVTTTIKTTKQPQTSSKIYTCDKYDSKYYIYRASGTRDYYTVTTTQTDTSIILFDKFTYRQRTETEVNPLPYADYKAGGSVTLPMMGDNGVDLTSAPWAGCIEERGTVSESSFSYIAGTGITPAGSNDLDLDSAPTSAPETKWAPLWPEIVYYRRSSSNGGMTNNATSLYGKKATSNCPYKAQLLTEMTQTQFNNYANALSPNGSTYLDIGMAWGGRLSSPQGIWKDNVNLAPANGGEVSRHLIFMTDGFMEPSNSIQSAWGIEYHDRRVTDDGSTDDPSRHTSRFLALCEAIKAKGIRVWAISFTSGSAVSSTLTTCASANSYYNADNPTQLNAAFQEIAKQVGELRLTQ